MITLRCRPRQCPHATHAGARQPGGRPPYLSMLSRAVRQPAQRAGFLLVDVANDSAQDTRGIVILSEKGGRHGRSASTSWDFREGTS
jgi:hypothetical protein